MHSASAAGACWHAGQVSGLRRVHSRPQSKELPPLQLLAIDAFVKRYDPRLDAIQWAGTVQRDWMAIRRCAWAGTA